MSSGSDVHPFSNSNGQANEMEKRRKHLDSLFEIALVLLGILSAAEFQYYLVVQEERAFYALRVFTAPFLVLIGFWLVKEVISDVLELRYTMLLTEFCWDFWSFTLFYFLLGIYGPFVIGIAISFVLSLMLVYVTVRAYRRASPVTTGDRSMNSYYRSIKWRFLRWLGIFFGSYILLVFIVWPW